jgi:hypothetical protein
MEKEFLEVFWKDIIAQDYYLLFTERLYWAIVT